ncbi:MAG TPA: oligosaccharide flippase family protein [Polyangiaceae bacterium]|nr:oligosaccharide flippase family protein [Polyangiaceae bacterium]
MRRVFKNAAVLMVAQVVAMPLSLVTNVVAARYLGTDEFGLLALASTFCSFGALAVEWGQGGALPALVAKDRTRAGITFGTALVWRLSLAPLVYAVLALSCWKLGYTLDFHVALALSMLGLLAWTTSGACQDAIRGFERTDVTAVIVVGTQLLNAAIGIPVFLLGGRLRAALWVSVVVSAAGALYAWRALRSIGGVRPSFERAALKRLLGDGTPFVALSASLMLQPMIDALFLSKLAPIEATAWLAAAKRLVGVLALPATALLNALYPTLSRLWHEDREGFRRSAGVGLQVSIALGVPLALGCFLYPDLGVRIYGRRSFGAAEDDLRVLSSFVLLLYFSMMLGCWLSAAKLSRAWAACQLLCVAVSAVADPLLIPFCQSRFHNGSLGVCVSTVLSEILMVAGGVWLAPPGVLTRSMWRAVRAASISGGAMTGSAWAMSRITPFVAAPISVLVYLACLWMTGALKSDDLALVRGVVARKFGSRGSSS